MKRLRITIILVVVVVLALLVSLVPAVPYNLSISNPGFPYTLGGYQSCATKFGNTINSTNDKAWNACIAQYIIPPINVTGYGSLSYSVLGIGVRPFPALFTVGENEGEGEFYAILHMSGSKIVAAEEVPQSDVVYNPSGIAINSSLSVGFLGEANVTVSVSDQSGQTLINPGVFISVPGPDSGNYTDKKGLQWMFTIEAPDTSWVGGPCVVNGIRHNLTSGATCNAALNPFISASPGSTFRYSVEVRGYLGTRYAVSKQTFSYSPVSQTVNRTWVRTFIGLVNQARNGTSLTESTNLDRFASLRFNTAVTQPDISDYGLLTDESSFFGANVTRTTIVELLLYPTNQSPYSYTTTLQGSARGHWAALLNKSYTHFGYYVGSGPYVSVNLPCPVTEIPRAGVNITQFFTNAGCSVSKIQSTTWVVVILSN